MKISLSWLKEYVEVDMTPAVLADALTMAGLEVDSVEDRYHYLDSVVVARVLAVNPHPNADRLTCCDISLGDRTTTVICGAPNVKKDMLTPCALPGTVLPDGRTITAGTIRGENSDGMLCSALELALGDDASGIMDLEGDLEPGTALNQALGLTDPVFEIDLTPNRPDCLSIIGVAREIAAFQGNRVVYPEPVEPATSGSITELTSVQIKDADLCPRYTARMIVDITVGPSPFWLRDRLMSVGLKPISNIVDITNFVMMETGQPLHAFDFDQLAENRIVVRAAAAGEKFTTLDGKERTLPENTLMICDGDKAVGIGGVMGGLNSEIESDTRRVLLESACFNPISIRKTAKQSGLATDASHRFERGVDPAGTVRALNRAAYLMAELGGGKLIDGTIDENPRPYEQRTIALSVNATNRRLGTDLAADRMKAYLEAIEFTVDAADTDTLLVQPPSYRVDVTRPEDISEEIARLYGYNNISTTFPLIPAKGRRPEPVQLLRERIRNFLTGNGFCETVNYSFISGESPDRLGLPEADPRRAGVPILNPISEDQAVMRTSLVPGLLETMGRNLSVQNRTLMLYEIGNTFLATGKADSLPIEKEMLTALWTGERAPFSWHGKAAGCDFFDIKGVAEALTENLGIPKAVFTRVPTEGCIYTRPGATARVQVAEKTVGLLGEVAPAVLKQYDLKQSAFILEFDIAGLLEAGTESIDARPIPRYPATTRDITLIIAESIESVNLTEFVEKLDEHLAESVTIFDVYTGAPIETGKKSVSIRITYRSSGETLEDNAVNDLHTSISGQLISAFDASLPA
jgi:phenylalanyl-tRNA synthetase beta chain